MRTILGLICGAVALGALPATAGDVREKVELTVSEREHLKAGMRAYLDNIQGVVEGLSKHDFKAVSRAATKSGMAAVKSVPVALALRLPPQFTLMSIDTHEKFDALAREAGEAHQSCGQQGAQRRARQLHRMSRHVQVLTRELLLARLLVCGSTQHPPP